MANPIVPHARYGHWAAIEPLPMVLCKDGKRRTVFWLCKCDCGTIKQVRSEHLRAGRTKSCGCFGAKAIGQRSITHGKSRTPEYISWQHMRKRCYNVNNVSYKNYGGRGIKVCNAWRYNFAQFLADMGERPTSKHTIERKDNDRDYEPENCLWIPRREQSKNRRYNLMFTINNETACLAEWARRYNVNYDAVANRLKRYPFLSIEQALRLPTDGNGAALRRLLKDQRET